jgi:hypothetical protein
MDKDAKVIWSKMDPLRAVLCNWHHSYQFLQAIEPKQRIFDLRAAFSRVVDDPSGIPDVDGSRESSSWMSRGRE